MSDVEKTVEAPHPTGATIRLGALWGGINTLVLKVANILIMIFIVRIVSPHDFGVFSVALVVHVIVTSFAELGLSSCLSRRDMEPSRVAPTVAALSIASATILAISTVLLADPLASALGAADAATAIRILSISIFLGGFTTVPGALLVRDFKQDRIFLTTLIGFVPANLALILLALHGDGAQAFAWSRLIGQVFAGAALFWFSRPWYGPRVDKTQALPVLRFGLPLAGANLLNFTLLNADYAFIGRSLGPTLLGVYTLAFNVASWGTSILGASINSVAMPAFSTYRRDPVRLRALLARSARIVSLVAIPLAMMTLVLARDLIAVLYGSTWMAAAPVLAILSVYGAIFVLSLLFSNLLVGTGRTGRVLVIQAVWLCALLPAVGLGVSQAGLTGAALAHVAVIVVVVIPVYFWALKPVVQGLTRLLLRASGPPALAALASAGAAQLVISTQEGSIIRLLTGSVVGGLLYAICALPLARAYLPSPLETKLRPVLKAYDAGVAKVSGRLSREAKQ